MRKEASRLWFYIRRVCRHWWFLLVEVVLVTTDALERYYGIWIIFPLWSKIVIGVGVLFIAQYLTYRELAIEKENLQAKKPALAIYPQAGAAFYVHIGEDRRTLGAYLELPITVQNDGDINSIIRRLDLLIRETGESLNDVKTSPRNMVLTRRAQHMLRQNWIAPDDTILVGAHNCKSGLFPVYITSVIGDEVDLLHVRLTIRDTEGSTATAEIALTRVG
jgi:hypothetical protein